MRFLPCTVAAAAVAVAASAELNVNDENTTYQYTTRQMWMGITYFIVAGVSFKSCIY